VRWDAAESKAAGDATAHVSRRGRRL